MRDSSTLSKKISQNNVTSEIFFSESMIYDVKNIIIIIFAEVMNEIRLSNRHISSVEYENLRKTKQKLK